MLSTLINSPPNRAASLERSIKKAKKKRDYIKIICTIKTVTGSDGAAATAAAAKPPTGDAFVNFSPRYKRHLPSTGLVENVYIFVCVCVCLVQISITAMHNCTERPPG